MITVVDFCVCSLDLDYLEVSWRIGDTSEDVLDYTFQVFRSESPGGPWDAVTEEFTDRYVVRDILPQPFHAGRMMYYILRVKNDMTNEMVEYGPSSKKPDDDLVSLELKRHLQILFREFAGTRCWILPVRTFGQRCPSCWDKTLSKRTRSGCTTCFDTGFVRGYLNPVEVWLQIDPGSSLNEQNQNTGPTHQSNTTARIPDYGLGKTRDILVEGDNRRWRINSVNYTEHNRAPVMLEYQMHRVPEGDIEYKIPINLSEALRDLRFSPSRNFTNPSNLESFQKEEIPKIYSMYSGTYTKVT
jgi:hypothetical protein